MADNFVIGPGAGKSQVQQFHDFLLSEVGNIPFATQWVLQIDRLPAALETNLDDSLENGKWNTGSRAATIKKVLAEGAFIDKGVCIFTQGVQTPREGLSVLRIGPNDTFQGGLLGAPISNGRNALQELNIAFLETNYSFIDFVVRPWIVYASHYGLMARLPDDPKNIKTTLQIYYYDRGNGYKPTARKIFRFYNAAPVLTEGIISSWDDQEVKKIYTSWTYTHYDVSIEDVASAVNKIRNNPLSLVNITKNLPSGTGGLSLPSISTTIPTGSALFSNPTGFVDNSTFKPTGGTIIGGSFSDSIAKFRPPGT